MPQPEPFAPDLFNTAAYARLHAHRYGDAMRRNHPGGGVFQAARVAPGHYASPGRAPHGGFDAPEELSDDDLAAFVRETESALRLLGARVVGLTMPPSATPRAPDRGDWRRYAGSAGA